MNHIAEKIEAGVLNLKAVSKAQLIQWARETQSQQDRDILGTEIMYGGGR